MKIKLTILGLVTNWILIVVIGCSPQTSTTIHDLTNGDGQDVLIDNSESVSLTPTEDHKVSSAQIPTVLSTKTVMTPTPDLNLEIGSENDVVSDTPTQEVALHGNIYFRSSIGISRFSLETDEVVNLLAVEPDWDDLGFTLSPDRQSLVYWLHKGDYSELWITELSQWSPELVFTTSGIEHEWISLWWVSDQYLLFEPGYFDQRTSFFIPATSYLINIFQQTVELETDSLIFGCSLSVSSQSNQIATWCPVLEEWTDPQTYFSTSPSYYVVLESNGEYWSSELAPAEVLIEFRGLPEDIWSWSYQEEFVSFSEYDEATKVRTLYYVNVQSQSLLTIEDDSRWYHSIDWSPNQQYISYVGDCSGRGCNKIFDTESQLDVWTSTGLPGAENGTYLNWSPDSNYIIVESEGVTILDIKSGATIRNLQNIPGGVIAWVP